MSNRPSARSSTPWALSEAKRAFDLCLALPLLVIATPILVVLVMIVQAGSDGPAVFSQARLGRGRRMFFCRKLRTMQAGTPSVATHHAPVNAVTRAGVWLRRFKLDELPQLWNVVKGEMSLVGPRPCLPVQAELVALREASGVFSLRPGITGLAQVRGIDMSTPDLCAASDAEYAATASFTGDLALLARTVLPRRR